MGGPSFRDAVTDEGETRNTEGDQLVRINFGKSPTGRARLISGGSCGRSPDAQQRWRIQGGGGLCEPETRRSVIQPLSRLAEASA